MSSSDAPGPVYLKITPPTETGKELLEQISDLQDKLGDAAAENEIVQQEKNELKWLGEVAKADLDAKLQTHTERMKAMMDLKSMKTNTSAAVGS